MGSTEKPAGRVQRPSACSLEEKAKEPQMHTGAQAEDLVYL